MHLICTLSNMWITYGMNKAASLARDYFKTRPDSCSLWGWLLVAGAAQESRKVKVKSLPGRESSAIILWLLQVSWSLFPS